MVNISACECMTDHFEGIDKLVKEAPHTEGAPNFRRLPGFPVFGSGQPTIEGFSRCIEPIEKKYGDEKNVYWVNLRQEPVVYVNGNPFTAREKKKLHQHITVETKEETIKLEEAFAAELKSRGEEFKYFTNQFGEHPEDRATKDEAKSEKLGEISTLSTIFTGLKEKNPKVEAVRIPFIQDKAPTFECFDVILDMLKGHSASTPIIFNCQAGISRTTTAMVIAAIVKEFHLCAELNQMKGIVPDDILEALKKKKLGLPGIDFEAPAEKNAMLAGDFEVILELIAAKGEAAKVAKAQVDKLIDLASNPPRGTGVSNIRECIIETKMTFDVSADEYQDFLKEKIMNNIERYFYLIVFAMFVREVGPHGFNCSFSQWMSEREDLKTMIDEGRGKLEWERKIPDEKLGELRAFLEAADFKERLPKCIKRIYELAWEQFSDLPRGHHKNNSMHKLASKTMVEILPEKLIDFIEAKCGSLATTPDFFDVIGQVSWYDEATADEEIKIARAARAAREAEEAAQAAADAAAPAEEAKPAEAKPAEEKPAA